MVILWVLGDVYVVDPPILLRGGEDQILIFFDASIVNLNLLIPCPAMMKLKTIIERRSRKTLKK